MPNPGSLPPLNSSLLNHSAEQDSCRRLSNVMLPPGWSSWQARVHNKFEGFSQGLRPSFASSCSGRRSSCGQARPSPRIQVADGDHQHGAKLSSINVAQFCAAPLTPPILRRTAGDQFGEPGNVPEPFFHGAVSRSCETRLASNNRLNCLKFSARVYRPPDWLAREGRARRILDLQRFSRASPDPHWRP
jgi:hypothetical protein